MDDKGAPPRSNDKPCSPMWRRCAASKTKPLSMQPAASQDKPMYDTDTSISKRSKEIKNPGSVNRASAGFAQRFSWTAHFWNALGCTRIVLYVATISRVMATFSWTSHFRNSVGSAEVYGKLQHVWRYWDSAAGEFGCKRRRQFRPDVRLMVLLMPM